MKWWILSGILMIGGMMVVNEALYGNAAAFGVATGMIVAMLFAMKKLNSRRRLRLGALFALLIGSSVYFGIPNYSIVEAERSLKKVHEDVTYVHDVGVVNEGWNPFQPKRVYVFEIEAESQVLFLPDSGEVIKTRPPM
ncbi:hypothetical protein [Exiguobacterium sp.]|uniref:hypothetical protein n=1 Tax=Exiguobacterium sp. TaxID=44751 RepID=UPI00263B4BF9|nr:hypothetical protein [Exiguobacterium sp.]MCC5893343.1 hypothetical protein [Exiguobacterium sp.]